MGFSLMVLNADKGLGGRGTIRGTPGREPNIPNQIPNIPYQIWNSMSFLMKYVNTRGTPFHMSSEHRVHTVLASFPSF